MTGEPTTPMTVKQFFTELREPYRGSRWAGPTIEAISLEEAENLMRDSPYKVVGESLATTRLENGDVSRWIQRGELKVQ